MTIQSKIRQLLQASALEKDSDFNAYVEAIEFLKDYPSPEVLEGMLQSLTDKEAGEIQYELIEACEAYPDEEYLRIFGRNARGILNRAPEWGGMMLQSILNTPSCCEVLYQMASERKESLADLWSWIAAIAENEPKYKHILAKINERMRPTSGDSGLR